MAKIPSLAGKYSRLLIFDTETTGLSFSRDEIIQFSCVVMALQDGEYVPVREYDELVALSPGGFVPPKITELTGITNEDLAQRGIPKERLCREITEMLTRDTLLMAYNAHFDLSFLYYLLLRHGDPAALKGLDKLDLLTVYRDRQPYPHKLLNAIQAYGLQDKVVNSHRAIDDVLATAAVLGEMAAELDDFSNYVNLFGYLARYGLGSKPIGSVTYKPQGFEPGQKLYMA